MLQFGNSENGITRNKTNIGRGGRIALAAVVTVIAGSIAVRMQATPHHARQAAETVPIAFSLPAQPPKGALLLFTGKADQFANNWYQRYSMKPAVWTVDAKGIASPKDGDITSKQEFGDCFVHAEFRTPVGADGKKAGEGNSGVGLQGRYEVQIYDSYGDKPEEHGCGALYSQKPPIVNASKKPGEWQTYDIIFRAPRFGADNKLTENARATVFQNGVIVQNNEEFTGMTGIQYGEYKEMTKTGPIVLQGDHDPVQFRNVWVVPQ